MSILNEVATPVNTQTDYSRLDAFYAGLIFAEMAMAAEREWLRLASQNVPLMPWSEFVDMFRRVFAATHKVDLSSFATPAAPSTPDAEFAQWVNRMEAEFGDMADAQSQQLTGLVMF